MTLSRAQSTADLSDESGAGSTLSHGWKVLPKAIHNTEAAALPGALTLRGWHSPATIHCPAYNTIVIITLLKFPWEAAEARSIY